MKTIEERYKKASQREHVLLKSEMYIGDIQKQNEKMWVYSGDEKKKMIKKMISYSPGFLKIFDEILTNATDHDIKTKSVSMIKVEYSEESGEISVWNDGDGIPVVIHKEHNVYVPELIFGNLLSGSNFDKEETKTSAGTFGLGSKLTNIFSKKFTIETVDSKNKLKFVQEYSNNMENKSKPKVTKNSGKSYTKFTFIPDYSRFSMNGLEKDTLSLLIKRVYDCIACTDKKVSIYLNGKILKGKGLNDYIKYFFEDKKIYYENNFDSEKVYLWEYGVIPADEYNHISFVNGNNTYLGGTHVTYITNQIVNKLKNMIESKKKIKDIKSSFIKDKLFIFLRSTIRNPSFNSQTKETLITQVSNFGCKIEVSDKFIEKLYKSEITDEIVKVCKIKEKLDLSKHTDGHKSTKVYIDKLEDANWAGTKKSQECSLFLTEGLSASKFAKDGRTKIGNNIYGIYPLKGKVLNIRDASTSQLINNEEINNIKQIIGLKQNVEYNSETIKNLRYGKIIILTDSDQDGIAIGGLILNIFHYWWPSLIKLNFIQKMITPIVRITKNKELLDFYTLQDLEKYIKQNKTNNLKFKYYKGLGTWEQKECQKLFENFNKLLKQYYYKDKECDNSMKLAFEKEKEKDDLVSWPDKRKEWLSHYDSSVYIPKEQSKISLNEMVNKELIHFSIYDNIRSIPNFIDGFKPSQRKILHYMLKKNIINDIKVAQLSGYVSAETSYHHGEMSLQKAIIAMAQNFIGSNNINLLYPSGNFGSRTYSGADAASPRYIYTRLTNLTKLIFKDIDNPLLDYLEDDGNKIEPKYFLPIIPMILVNGSEGIGTGYSTFIPSFNIIDIIDNLLLILGNTEIKNEDLKKLIPYYKNFKGHIIYDNDTNTYKIRGIYSRISNTQIKITELPINVNNYKTFIENKIKVKNAIIKDYINNTKDDNTDIEYIIEFNKKEDLDKLIENNKLEKELKLVSSISLNNMYVFDENLHLIKYKDPNDLLLDFYDIRIDYYEKRRLYLIEKLEQDILFYSNKMRFIKEYLDGKLIINKKSKEFIINTLKENKYNTFNNSYEYLYMMPMISLSLEKFNELEKQINKLNKDLEYMTNISNIKLWKNELIELKEYLLKN